MMELITILAAPAVLVAAVAWCAWDLRGDHE